MKRPGGKPSSFLFKGFYEYSYKLGRRRAKKPGDLTPARCLLLGFWALCIRNSLTKLTTREVGKHTVVSKHPPNHGFCANTMIFRLKIWNQNSRANHEMSAIAWMKLCVSGSWCLHTNSERYLKRSGLASHGKTREVDVCRHLCML